MRVTILCLFVVVLSSCAKTKSKVIRNQNVGPALGTSYSLIYLANEDLDFQKEIDSVFLQINKSMSTYIPNSDISRINAGEEKLVVDTMFAEVFKLSKEIYENTNGYFDPTVGTLVNAWGFGPEKQIMLDSMRVDSLMNYVGFDKVALTNANTILKEDSNIYFDFNAIAKGYAIDRLGVLMNQKGIENYLLEVGGEIVSKGWNSIKQKPWHVAVTDPEGGEHKTVIALKDRAMASSGNYRHFRIDQKTGRKYVHTINPKTGYTQNGSTLAVNILAENCATADAYATALMAMSLAEAKNILNKQKGLDAYIIYLDVDNETKEFMTDGFKQLLVP